MRRNLSNIRILLTSTCVLMIILVGCTGLEQVWPQYDFEPRNDFFRNSSETPSSDSLELTYRAVTYALTNASPPDTVPLYLEAFYLVPGASTLGRRILRNEYHPDSAAKVWVSIDLEWNESANPSLSDTRLRIDSIFLEYVDEHRTRPFSWVDKSTHTNDAQDDQNDQNDQNDRNDRNNRIDRSYVKLGHFPLDGITVRDILDARKVRQLPRYRLTFDAELTDSSGKRISRGHFETFMSFSTPNVPINDSTRRHTEGRREIY